MDFRQFGVYIVLACAAVATAQEPAKPLSLEDAKKLKNPIPFSKKSVAEGKSTFARYCSGCHGADGKAMVDVVADATDLTAPKAWKSGTSDGEIFRSIRDGQSASMPAFLTQIKKEEDLWHLVNFIRNLWPESTRPPLKENQSGQPPAGKDK